MGPTITTSISIHKTLFDQTEILAQRLNISQSQLFESAIANFIANYQSPTPLDEFDSETNAEINEVIQGQPATNEQPKSSRQATKTARQVGGGNRVVDQGDIYWVHVEHPNEREAGILHPHVVLQDNLFNHSRIHSVVVCALTSNIKRIANTPGNVLLEVGEANLPKQSVVEVSKVSTVDKTRLGEYIGSLSEQRIREILTGMRFLQKSFFAR
jgi:mRNA interferase MazF